MSAVFQTATIQTDGYTVYMDFDGLGDALVENDTVSGVRGMVRQGLETSGIEPTALVAAANLYRLVVSLPYPVYKGQDVYLSYGPGNLVDVAGAASYINTVRATNNSTVAPVITDADLSGIASRLRERLRER